MEQTLNLNTPILSRIEGIRQAFQNASDEVKNNILELVPFAQKDPSTNNVVGFCDWSQFDQFRQIQ